MRSRKTLYAALVYLALTIAVTYPLIGQLSTHIAGLAENDVSSRSVSPSPK